MSRAVIPVTRARVTGYACAAVMKSEDVYLTSVCIDADVNSLLRISNSRKSSCTFELRRADPD